MLSKIENAQASPSLSTLARISTALDVPLTAFFDSFQAHTVLHVKAGRGLDLVPRGSRSGVRSQLLGNLRGTQRRLEPILYTLNRRSKVSESFRHPGTEFLYMIEGTMEYGYGAQRFILERGDSLQFDGEVTHGPGAADRDPGEAPLRESLWHRQMGAPITRRGPCVHSEWTPFPRPVQSALPTMTQRPAAPKPPSSAPGTSFDAV